MLKGYYFWKHSINICSGSEKKEHMNFSEKKLKPDL